MSSPWIPRLAVEAMPPALAEYLAPRVRRLGYLGEMFQVGANAPAVLLEFMRFTDALKEAVPLDISETVVLTVAARMRNAYERNQHERLCLRSGLGREWITEVQALAPEASRLMTPGQRGAQRFALSAVDTEGLDATADFDALREHFDAATALSIAFLVGRYTTHALLVNTLRLAPPVPSVFEDGFIP